MICYAKLPVTYNITAIQQELLCRQQNWLQHLNSRHYTGDWKVLSLTAPGGKASNNFSELLGNSLFEATGEMDHFPAVSELLARMLCEKMSVRFLNLAAGSSIKEHRDRDLSFEQGEARLHFPVTTNHQVNFCVEGEQIVMEEGSCWYINANLLHKVDNFGSTDRVHLVVDCKVNDWLSELMEQADKKTRNSETLHKDLNNIVAALRLQNTATSIDLANKLESGEMNL
jgi:mannose-6-phosphate isomerase-like protein (cupin superfamily)